MTLVRRALGAALGVLFALVPLAVSAHATLESSSPAASERRAAPVTGVRLTFDEAVETALGSVRVLDASGTDRATGGTYHPDGNAGIVAVRTTPLTRGRYVVAWSVISDDGHPVSGAYAFGVDEAAGSVPDDIVQASVPGAAIVVAILRALLLAGLLVGLGLAMGAMLVARSRGTIAPGMFELGAWLAVAFAAFLDIRVQAALNDASLLAVLGTHYGILRLILMVAGLLCAIAVTAGRRRYPLLLIGAPVAAVSESLAGHAAVGILPLAGVVTDLLHLLAAAAWIGVLLTTMMAPDRVDVRRTSTVASLAVAVIAVSSIVQALRNIATWDDLITTTYGVLVCAKIVLLGVVLIVAWFSRRRVRAGAHAVARIVRIELAVLFVIVLVTAVLVDGKPPRASAADAHTARTSFTVDGIAVTVVAVSRDALHWTVDVRAAQGGRAVDPAQITLSLRERARGVGPLDVPVRRTSLGSDTATVALPFAGAWELSAGARVGEFDENGATLRL